MNKEELLTALTNTWQNYALGMLLPELITEDGWKKYHGQWIRFGGPDGNCFNIGPDWVIDVLENPLNRNHCIGEFDKALKRAVIREGYELLLLYCEETNQMNLLKAEPWFQFARILRNIVSHKGGGVLREWPNELKKKGITNVSWRDRNLDVSMVREEIPFTPHEALKLIADQMAFAMNKLS